MEKKRELTSNEKEWVNRKLRSIEKRSARED
jgi:hypothetical protein